MLQGKLTIVPTVRFSTSFGLDTHDEPTCCIISSPLGKWVVKSCYTPGGISVRRRSTAHGCTDAHTNAAALEPTSRARSVPLLPLSIETRSSRRRRRASDTMLHVPKYILGPRSTPHICSLQQHLDHVECGMQSQRVWGDRLTSRT